MALHPARVRTCEVIPLLCGSIRRSVKGSGKLIIARSFVKTESIKIYKRAAGQGEKNERQSDESRAPVSVKTLDVTKVPEIWIQRNGLVTCERLNTPSVVSKETCGHPIPLGSAEESRFYYSSVHFTFAPAKEGSHEAKNVKRKLDSNVISISMVQSKECR